VLLPRKLQTLGTCLGAGLFGAVALGCVNQAAHAPSWDLRVMFAAFGAYSICASVRLAGPRRPAFASGGLLTGVLVVAGALLPMAAAAPGRVVWAGGTWIAAAGAVVAFLAALSLGESFGIAPSDRGTVVRGPYGVVRHPMAASLLMIAVGYLLARFSPWNAAVLGIAAGAAIASALCEERVLGRSEEYRSYAARVRWRFVPGLV
jgi:protein-S-isoprenylcysteine O-methyltransferase Ste14